MGFCFYLGERERGWGELRKVGKYKHMKGATSTLRYKSYRIEEEGEGEGGGGRW